jgi:hypothetical protein
MINNRIIDETGNRHGRLKVLRMSSERKRGKPAWLCLCDCGKSTSATGADLRAGEVKSCGCLKMDSSGRRMMRRFFGRQNPLDNVDDDIL